MRLFISAILFFSTIISFAQNEDFDIVIQNPTTTVKDQEETGSCWAYAACSFFESELLRANKGEYDLSEAYLVYYAYLSKGDNYFYRQSQTSFPAGALMHDALNVVEDIGIVPNYFYKGQYLKDGVNDYFEMRDSLKYCLDSALKSSDYNWHNNYEHILNKYLGELPTSFKNGNKTNTPLEYANSLGLEWSNYVSFTSFTHHPFYAKCVLEIPDNFSSGTFYNLPIEKLIEIIDTALIIGYTFIWNGDVSEPTFSTIKKGIAMLPERNEQGELIFEIDVPEIPTSQKIRQVQFDKLQTTDDHLMQCVGLAKSKNGIKYYIMKNSWGKVGPHNGYTYMSETYQRMKTVSIMLNKNGLPEEIRNKIIVI